MKIKSIEKDGLNSQHPKERCGGEVQLTASSPLAVVREDTVGQETPPNSDCSKDLEILISVNRAKQIGGRDDKTARQLSGMLMNLCWARCRRLAGEEARLVRSRAFSASERTWFASISPGAYRKPNRDRALRDVLRIVGWSRRIRQPARRHFSLRLM